ncbi:hypothetical protein D9H39_07345 [Escherichia coli]|nr:hypothetical protein [Escherichia coli]EEW2199259.1 hypothetical protein [Escherichia coli]EFC1968158.1 hypothetical protein [Escherichia coli]EFD1019750.1 hypothetical protein [Escherichia coli]EFN5579688.1 hypothetical protein [Escherichia coli]
MLWVIPDKKTSRAIMNNFLVSDNQRLVFPWMAGYTFFIKFLLSRPKILHRSTGKRNHVKTYQNCDQLTAGFGRFWPFTTDIRRSVL